jgi:predicted O-methyltransferase YrrM
MDMSQERWTSIDKYITDLLVPSDQVLDETLKANIAGGLPQWDVAPNQGKLLMLLAQIRGARRILEIGTLGGYSTIWLGRALPSDGHLVTLESDPKHAEVAQENIVRAGLSDLVELRIGPALDTLSALEGESIDPFDFIFIDADKQSNPEYLQWALRLSRPGTVIITDNVVLFGAILDSGSTDPNIQGIRDFMESLAAEPRLSATAVQTVGSKGHDGFAIAVVNG